LERTTVVWAEPGRTAGRIATRNKARKRFNKNRIKFISFPVRPVYRNGSFRVRMRTLVGFGAEAMGPSKSIRTCFGAERIQKKSILYQKNITVC